MNAGGGEAESCRVYCRENMPDWSSRADDFCVGVDAEDAWREGAEASALDLRFRVVSSSL